MDKRWAACVPLTAAFVGWVQLPQSLPEELGKRPPEPTSLNASGFYGDPWPPRVAFNETQRELFRQTGFAVMRNLLPQDMAERLAKGHRLWCGRGDSSSPQWHCKTEDVWARSDFFRDFIWFSPLGKNILSLLWVKGVRIYGDQVAELRREHSGMPYHFDNSHYGGIFGEFRVRSRGAIVFLFLSSVDRDKTGGSVLFQPGAHRGDCAGAAADPALQPRCREEFYKKAIALNFKPGDALVLHPLMPHATQGALPTAPANFSRISYMVRLVETNAVFCGTDAEAREAGMVDCRHHLRPGERAHHVCFQQIFPLLKEEVEQRMDTEWYRSTCNVQQGWRYTGLTKLQHWARGLVSQLRMRLRGWAPVGREKPECALPPARPSKPR